MQEERSAGYEFVIVALLALFWGCVGLNRFGIGMIFPLIVPEFHLEGWQTGLLISGTSITWAISSWIGGWLSDRHGRRKILLPAVGFVALMTAAMGGAWSFLSMFVVRDLLGLGDGVGWSVGQATINEESSPRRRGINQAVFTVGYTLIGVGLGAIIITWLTVHLGWRYVFPIIGGATAVIGIALFLLMREPPKRRSQTTDWRGGFSLLRDPSLAFITVGGCAVLTWLQIFIGFNALYLAKERQFSLVDAGIIVSIWGFAGAAGQILLPLISDRLGRRPVVLVSALVSAAALTLYLMGGYGLEPTQLLAGMCAPGALQFFDGLGLANLVAGICNLGPMHFLAALCGFCGFGLLPIVLATCVSESVSDEQRGAALGMTNFFGVIIGTTLMPFIGGVLYDHIGLAATLGIAVVAQLVVAASMLMVKETAPRVLARRGTPAGVAA